MTGVPIQVYGDMYGCPALDRQLGRWDYWAEPRHVQLTLASESESYPVPDTCRHPLGDFPKVGD